MFICLKPHSEPLLSCLSKALYVHYNMCNIRFKCRCGNVLLTCFCFILFAFLQPLRVNGVKVYTENVDKRQVIMDLQIRYTINVAALSVAPSSEP